MRSYRLGKRQASVDLTRRQILSAARDLVASGAPASVAAVARKAGVSRITVYNRFRSKEALLAGVLPDEPARPAPAELSPPEQLRHLLHHACARWAADPGLYRHLPPPPDRGEPARRLAERLAEADALRPGCSIKEAEDVIRALSSFQVFDQLHHDGRRPAAAVAEILMRLANGILA